LERHGLTGSHSTVIKSRLPGQVNRYQANGHHRNDELAYQNGHNQQMNGRPTNGLQAKPKLFVISSSDRDGVKRNAHRLRKYLDGKGEDQYHSLLNSLAYTLGERRTAMPWKSFVIASEMDGLIKSIDDAPAAVRSSDTHAQKIALVFTGQGAQWFAMGKNLEVYEVYRHSLLRCEETLRSFSCIWSLSVELGRPENECNLHLAEFSQPACTAIQIALVDLLHHWGITPSAVVGHSSGEIAAAYCAGAISRDVAMKIAWLRGQFAGVVARKNEKGAMMAVSADAETIRPRLAQLTRGRAVIACVNSPKACTVSGDEDAVDELCRMLREDQVNFTKLKIEVAYHSPHMEIIREAYEAALSGFEVGSFLDIIPMFSSVTGGIVRPESLGPRYWVDNLTSPVKFSDAVRALIHYSPEGKNALDRMAFASVFLEVGPHSALRSYLLDIFKSEDTFKDLSYVSLLRRGRNSLQTALQAVGELYTKGCTFSLSQVNETPGNAKLLVDLPPYSWNHSVSFWQESYLGQQHRSRERPRMDLLGYPVPGSPEPQWRNFLRGNKDITPDPCNNNTKSRYSFRKSLDKGALCAREYHLSRCRSDCHGHRRSSSNCNF
jgi:acyl transferase domain-containing protein